MNTSSGDFSTDKQRDFNQKVLDSIDRAFDSLGDSIELVLYLTLEKDYGIAKEDLPARFDAMSEVLKKVFGASGQKFMARLISEELVTEFDLQVSDSEEEKTVSALVKKAREKYLSESSSSR